ncbi:hypothetical protein AALB53_23050, partial [Lachnospiraceae bacterium 47-T17]
MDGRKRTVQIKFRVTEAERDLILEKMKLVPTRNMAAYLCQRRFKNVRKRRLYFVVFRRSHVTFS